MNQFDADYVIVGGGSAGCVLAARLSEDPSVRVLLLEAGGDDRPLHEPKRLLANLMIHMPGGFPHTLADPGVNWLYRTRPDSNGRVHTWPAGRVLGGSSSINGMLYVRGHAADYDGWRQMGCEGWGWADVLPYFRRAQHQERGACEFHGAGGPLNVADLDERHPVAEAVIAACTGAGLPFNADINGAHQDGVGWFQATTRGGKRCSAAVAYLHPAMRRAGLVVLTHARAERVLFDGRRATGVAFDHGGIPRVAIARREVIVAAGAIATPALLERSGVGDAAHVAMLGAEVVADLPGVGENLQDHYMTGMQWRLRPGAPSLNARARGLPLLAELLRYATRRSGMLAQAPVSLCAFACSRPGLASPDLQFHITPASMDFDALGERQKWALEREPGLTIAPAGLRPQSRGDVHAASPDPRDPPAIVPNYLSAAADVAVLTEGVRLARRIAAQPALSALIAHETRPGAVADDDAAIADYVRAVGTTLYHPVGTARMGHDPMAVVDPALRVRGVHGLRVVDASVMPTIPSGNTNAPTIMIAERAADLIRGEARAAIAA